MVYFVFHLISLTVKPIINTLKKYTIVAFMLVLVACSVKLTPLAEGDLL